MVECERKEAAAKAVATDAAECLPAGEWRSQIPLIIPSQQLIRRDRQVPDASPCRVEDGIRDGRRNPDHPEIAHAFHEQIWPGVQ